MGTGTVRYKWGIDLADRDLGADADRYKCGTGTASRELYAGTVRYKWGIDLADHDLGADADRYELGTGTAGHELVANTTRYEWGTGTAGHGISWIPGYMNMRKLSGKLGFASTNSMRAPLAMNRTRAPPAVIRCGRRPPRMGCEDRRPWNFLDTWTHEHAEAVREKILPVRKLGADTVATNGALAAPAVIRCGRRPPRMGCDLYPPTTARRRLPPETHLRKIIAMDC